MSDTPPSEHIAEMQCKAEAGDTAAQLDLAYWYLQGLGIEQNSQKAFEWYTKAARAGDAHGQYMLAWRYKLGDGVEADYAKAFYWFEQALKNDASNPYILSAVGQACFEGIGTEEDLTRAADCFRRASQDETQTKAIYYYGLCLLNGYGVNEDKELGLTLIQKAAAADLSVAKQYLEEMQNKRRTLEEAMAELDSMVGIDEVKKKVKRIIDQIGLCEFRKQHNLPSQLPNLHIIFMGNPGTGKTVVARILCDILRNIGFVDKGQLIETTLDELNSLIFNEAIGGVLLIDEAYDLSTSHARPSVLSINSLLKAMEDHRHELVVILSGYKDDMQKILEENPGLSSRFTEKMDFKNFNQKELETIFLNFCKQGAYQLTDPAQQQVHKLLTKTLSTKIEHFGNARFVRNLFNEVVSNLASRVSKQEQKTKELFLTILAEDIPEKPTVLTGEFADHKQRTFEEAMGELNNMVGLKNVKSELERFIQYVKLSKQRKSRGLATKPLNIHFVFTGNPGTGKTTVARILGDVLRGLGILKTGHVVETSAVDLIAGYVGQTAIQVKKKVEKALGGILFIDEAYALIAHGGTEGDFGADAINTLVKLMEDHRDELVVIAAGYKEEMQKFIHSNPGLASRFTNFVEFENYNQEELVQIFKYFCVSEGYELTDNASKELNNIICDVLSRKINHFSNGRFIRNLFRECIINLSGRVSKITDPSNDDLVNILSEDIVNSCRLNNENIVIEELGKKIGFY